MTRAWPLVLAGACRERVEVLARDGAQPTGTDVMWLRACGGGYGGGGGHGDGGGGYGHGDGHGGGHGGGGYGDGYGSTLWLAIAEVTLADGMTLRSRDDALEHLRALARAMGYDV